MWFLRIFHIFSIFDDFLIFQRSQAPERLRAQPIWRKVSLKFSLMISVMCLLGVKVRNMKMDFNTRGTWRRVRHWKLMMKTYDIFFNRLSHLVALHNNIKKNHREDGIFFTKVQEMNYLIPFIKSINARRYTILKIQHPDYIWIWKP